MLVYKCDGKTFSTGKKCASEEKDELPTSWLLISGKIKNGLYDAHYIEANGSWHFCSLRCLENFLLKDVNPAQGNGPLNTMNIDPNVKAEEVKEDQANDATGEPKEEGTTEG